jgi:hypothetical protein
VAVFSISDGNLDDTDLSGVNFAFCNLFPDHLTAGDWKVGIVIDEGASDEQAQALERIVKGEEGGPFGDLSAMYGEWLGAERAPVTFSGGDKPSASVGAAWSTTFEPLPGPGDTQTTVKNAMFGFAPEYRIGNAPGHNSLFELEFDGIYGETADCSFSSEMAEEAPKGRV